MKKTNENLRDMIVEHMAMPGDVPEQQPEADFVISGLRAAVFVSPIARRKILSDIATLIGCRGRDLEFLFGNVDGPSVATHKYEVMVPDFQSQLLAIAE